MQCDIQPIMDINQYNRIYSYLTQQIIPTELITPKSIKQFKNFCIPYTVQNNYLYRNDKRNPGKLLRVIRTHEMEAILYMMYNDLTARHFTTDIIFEKIRKRYYWPQMYENIRTYSGGQKYCITRTQILKLQFFDN